jgi:hypothetical protein
LLLLPQQLDPASMLQDGSSGAGGGGDVDIAVVAAVVVAAVRFRRQQLERLRW